MRHIRAPLSMEESAYEGKSFDTAELKTKQRPLWEDVDDKISYLLRFEETDAGTENVYYRVFAYARKPMCLRRWRKMFKAFEVTKIDGQLEEYEPFTSRLHQKPGRMVARHTIKQMADTIQKSRRRIKLLAMLEHKAPHTTKQMLRTITRLQKRIKLLEDEARNVAAKARERKRKKQTV